MAKTYEARVEVDAEVIGVFRDMIPERAFGPDGELATPRQRNECTPDHPSAIFFLGVHTILHDILGIDTIITRYLRYFTSANMFKICIFFF